jgi:hypothetical protein
MLATILGLVPSILDKVIPDPVERDKAKLEFMKQQQSGLLTELQGQIDIIQEEAKSEHWLTANWRPLTMLTFVVIIANNYILYPYLSLFWPEAPQLSIPPDMWDLLKIGLGGYVVGRSAEKGLKIWKEPGK